jgi:hypothetical protein
MKIAALAGAALVWLTGPVFAQSSQDPPRMNDTPAAIASPSNVNKTTTAPVAGKNSFTRDEVKKRLEDNGYTGITGLAKDSQSVWRGTATMSGKPVNVAVDYQGNITAN